MSFASSASVGSNNYEPSYSDSENAGEGANATSLQPTSIIERFKQSPTVRSFQLFQQLFIVDKINFYDRMSRIMEIKTHSEAFKILFNNSLIQSPFIRTTNEDGHIYVYFSIEIPLLPRRIVSIYEEHSKWTISEFSDEGESILKTVIIDHGEVIDNEVYLKYKDLFQQFFKPKIAEKIIS